MLQNIKMLIVGHNIGSIGSYCAIYELIVIRVSVYQTKTKGRTNQFYIFSIGNDIEYHLCKLRRMVLLFQYLAILH